jgi:hypothetical protein
LLQLELYYKLKLGPKTVSQITSEKWVSIFLGSPGSGDECGLFHRGQLSVHQMHLTRRSFPTES